MGKKSKVLIILFVFTTLLTGVVKGTTHIEINQLIENSIDFDNKEVTIQGEAIGELLERGNYSWVNINDGTNTIGVWIKTEEAKLIMFWGDYKHKGDIVKISGIFSRDCTEHGGDVDIHNVSLNIIEKGYNIKENVDISKIYIGTFLTFITLIVAFFCYRAMRR